MLEILYQDEEIIAVNKPHGLLVHRTNLAKDATEFALQKVRDLVGKRVHPVHRLDRKTSGVLLFAKSKEANSYYHQLFSERKVKKHYEAIVRGQLNSAGTIDYPIGETEKKKEAKTDYTPIDHFELPIAFGKFKTSRYTHLHIEPLTGRFHQIRKHMKHIFHPIIGDRPHGCNKQNRLWKEKFEMNTMLLHANLLELETVHGKLIKIKADKQDEFKRVLSILYDGKK